MRGFVLVLGSALTLSVGAASAQSPTAPSPPSEPARLPALKPLGAMSEKQAIEEARQHFARGIALYNDGNYEGALAEFNATNALRPSPGVLYNIGLTQKALFRYKDAIDSLDQYLRDEKKMPRERRAQVQQLIKEMRELLADISIYVEPDGATVSIDGRTEGKAPLRPVALPAGRHIIDITAEGYKPAHREIMVTAQKPMPVSIKLEALPKTGKVRILASQPGAKVAIDGRDHGFAPVEVELPGGAHRLDVSAPAYATNTSELVITPGQPLRVVPVKLEMPAVSEQKFYHKWWFWTIVGVAAAGATVGTIAALSGTEEPIPGTIAPGVAPLP